METRIYRYNATTELWPPEVTKGQHNAKRSGNKFAAEVARQTILLWGATTETHCRDVIFCILFCSSGKNKDFLCFNRRLPLVKGLLSSCIAIGINNKMLNIF